MEKQNESESEYTKVRTPEGDEYVVRSSQLPELKARSLILKREKRREYEFVEATEAEIKAYFPSGASQSEPTAQASDALNERIAQLERKIAELENKTVTEVK